ncbi:AAA family ATPase [Eisenbergiella tayi]|uniref:DNA replication and repair protein RecF n=1 Tax=Eisenbergiella tayi TaxID=1432052 RepID=A0A1E3AC56_9FIRM|nr:AAA family ATPase [Eisenbergiella tayi]ODM06001.1 DNA replication and repair protein RecF [Eisenbergiella tayi]
MYLKEMQIRNFRNFHKAKFAFQKGVNVIIGENDSGKTNALQAIRLILDRRLNWYEIEITEEMFSDYLKNWKGHVIVISLRFGELDISNEEQAMLR